MNMHRARKWLAIGWRAVSAAFWCFLALWTALALFFTIPVPRWPAAALAYPANALASKVSRMCLITASA